PSSVGISVPSPYHLQLIVAAGKSRLTRSGARHRPLPGRVVPLRLFFWRAAPPPPRTRPAAGGALPRPPPPPPPAADRPCRVLALMLGNQPGDLGFEPIPAPRPGPWLAAGPLVEPGPGHPQRPAGHRGGNAVLLPLGGDERGHRYRPIASLTQRATLRLST